MWCHRHQNHYGSTITTDSSAVPIHTSRSDTHLPELSDMLRDCQQMQRALTRLTDKIQKYIDILHPNVS